jgi:hypothetical protein
MTVVQNFNKYFINHTQWHTSQKRMVFVLCSAATPNIPASFFFSSPIYVLLRVRLYGGQYDLVYGTPVSPLCASKDDWSPLRRKRSNGLQEVLSLYFLSLFLVSWKLQNL